MPSMQKTDEKIIAIFCADLHLSLRPPVFRSAENDWMCAMLRPLVELRTLAMLHNCPIIYAGDIFDKWNSSPELINFAIKHLPKGYAIPGQHDLPLHNYEDIEKSAYWTLVKADRIYHIVPNMYLAEEPAPLMLYGFSFGKKIKPRKDNSKTKHALQIAIVHEYKWIKGCSYPNADSTGNIENRQPLKRDGKCLGYDVIVYGDNHIGFQTNIGKTQIFNCGSLMRRNSDQIDYEPQVGLLTAKGKIISHKLDCSKDKYISDNIIGKETELDLTQFMNELEQLGDTAFDFGESVKRFFEKHKTEKVIRNIILNAMEKKK